MNTEFTVSTTRHRLLCKWWMRTRPCEVHVTPEGVSAPVELYCPWWALPLDALHALIFGSMKLLPA
jgi:hypothetical protein